MFITCLPSEVIAKILKELPVDSLRQCLFVCKTLSAEAARLCYHQVVLSNNHRSFLCAMKRSNGRSVGDYVRVLAFSYETKLSEKLNQEDFESLVANLPELATIQFDFTSHMDQYLKYMMSVPLHLLATVQNISIPSSSILRHSIFNDYILVTQRLRSTITTLCLDSFCVPFFNGNCSNVLQFLSEFTNLKSLSISNNTRTGLQGINVISVLRVCQKLAYFDLYSEFADMDELTTIAPLHDKQRKNTSLDSLKLNVQDLTETNIDYLLQNVRNSLKLFHLQIGNKGLGQWLKTTSQYHVRQFVDFLKGIQSVKIHMADDIRVDQKFDLPSSWNFIHQLYHNRLVYTLKILLSETTRCFHIIDMKQSQKMLEVCLCIPFSSLNDGIDSSLVNTISITNFSGSTSFDIEPTLSRILGGLNKQQLWGIKLLDGKRSLSVGPVHKKRSVQLYKSLAISGKYDSIPKNKMEIVTLNRYDVDDRILNTIASAYPKTKGIVFSKCNFVNCETVGWNNHRYNVNLGNFINLEEVQINLDIAQLQSMYTALSRFFIQIDYSYGKSLYYCCTIEEINDPNAIHYIGQCKLALLEEAENTFIIMLQSSQIEEITLKTKIYTNETYTYQIVVPYVS